MKLLFIFILSISCAVGQIRTPPNSISISDSLFLDATELGIVHWKEYLHFVSRDSSEAYFKSVQLAREVTANYRPDYYTNGSYRYYPVVGVTREQAVKYCAWRTKVGNMRLKKEQAGYRIRFRLPTEQEWEMAASSIDTLKKRKLGYPVVYRAFERADHEILFEIFGDTLNIRSLRRQIEKAKKEKAPYYVVDYPRPWFFIRDEKLPNTLYFPDYFVRTPDTPIKFYQLIGNVAEMVQEPGIVKGGSWRHKLEVSFPSKRIQIDPESAYDWVGFRCIAEILPADP